MTATGDTLKVAIVGAGPAGFYAAGMLLAEGHAVDLYDLLPTPFGLVRSGVAPDHPNIKAVTRVFDKAAAHPGFRFLGGVEVGVDVTREQLRERYAAVVYATGMSVDRKLGIPGEDLPGVHAAADFVGWYNAHPHRRGDAYDLSGRYAVVIGNGNVALDIARMLVLEPDELAPTDAAEHAVEALGRSSIEAVQVLGRRGAAQAAFTNPELRELGKLSGADVLVDPAEARPDPLSERWLNAGADGTAMRNVEILRDYAGRAPQGKPRRVVLSFLRSPVAFLGERRLEAVRLSVNAIAAAPDGSLAAVPTGAEEEVPADIAFRAIGYRARADPGPAVRRPRRAHPQRRWAPDRRTGAAATRRVRRRLGQARPQRRDRHEQEVRGRDRRGAARGRRSRAARLRSTPVAPVGPNHRPRAGASSAVDWAGWGRIDAHELEHGRAHGRARHKVVSIDEHARPCVLFGKMIIMIMCFPRFPPPALPLPGAFGAPAFDLTGRSSSSRAPLRARARRTPRSCAPGARPSSPPTSQPQADSADPLFLPRHLDVSDPVSWSALERELRERFGSVHGLVNNAAIQSRQRVGHVDPAGVGSRARRQSHRPDARHPDAAAADAQRRLDRQRRLGRRRDRPVRGRLRDQQVGPARAHPDHGRRAGAAGHPRERDPPRLHRDADDRRGAGRIRRAPA